MGALKMKWRTKKEVCGWVGLHHFLLMMIFWQLGNMNYHCKNRRKLWNTMEISWFFWSCFFLHYSFSFSFDDDATTFFKEGVVGERTIFFVAWISSTALLIFLVIIVVVKHLSDCCYCCDCFGNKLKKKYVRKMSTTKMSYYQASLEEKHVFSTSLCD